MIRSEIVAHGAERDFDARRMARPDVQAARAHTLATARTTAEYEIDKLAKQENKTSTGAV